MRRKGNGLSKQFVSILILTLLMSPPQFTSQVYAENAEDFDADGMSPPPPRIVPATSQVPASSSSAVLKASVPFATTVGPETKGPLSPATPTPQKPAAQNLQFNADDPGNALKAFISPQLKQLVNENKPKKFQTKSFFPILGNTGIAYGDRFLFDTFFEKLFDSKTVSVGEAMLHTALKAARQNEDNTASFNPVTNVGADDIGDIIRTGRNADPLDVVVILGSDMKDLGNDNDFKNFEKTFPNGVNLTIIKTPKDFKELEGGFKAATNSQGPKGKLKNLLVLVNAHGNFDGVLLNRGNSNDKSEAFRVDGIEWRKLFEGVSDQYKDVAAVFSSCVCGPDICAACKNSPENAFLDRAAKEIPIPKGSNLVFMPELIHISGFPPEMEHTFSKMLSGPPKQVSRITVQQSKIGDVILLRFYNAKGEAITEFYFAKPTKVNEVVYLPSSEIDGKILFVNGQQSRSKNIRLNENGTISFMIGTLDNIKDPLALELILPKD